MARSGDLMVRSHSSCNVLVVAVCSNLGDISYFLDIVTETSEIAPDTDL